MADALVSRLGQVNEAGDVKALFLKVYSGLVLTTFARTTQFMDRHMVRTIPFGKEAQFPALGRLGAFYHQVGTEILGGQMPAAERVIAIDDLLISPAFIAQIDEAMNHYEVRSEYARKSGEELAQIFDKNVARVGILAARSAATIAGLNGGSTIGAGPVDPTDMDDFVQAIFEAAAALDEKDVPKMDRWCAVPPTTYYGLVNGTSKAINRDFNPNDNGSVSEGVVINIAGIRIVPTNNLPQDDDSANTDIPPAYRGDYSDTSALVWQRQAMGTVRLINLAFEMEWDMRRQGTLLLSKMAVGHGILRPECAVEITTDAP